MKSRKGSKIVTIKIEYDGVNDGNDIWEYEILAEDFKIEGMLDVKKGTRVWEVIDLIIKHINKTLDDFQKERVAKILIS